MTVRSGRRPVADAGDAGLRTFGTGTPRFKPALKAFKTTARRLEGRR
jgi:hypothetical protein